MVSCTKCKETKPKDSFRKRKNSSNGLQYWCRKCENKANRQRYKPKPKKKKKQTNPKTIKRNARNRMLQHRYNITLEEYEQMYENQNGKCSICNDNYPSGGTNGLYVDHCHKTGNVRGLLCPRCNSLLGRFLDDQKILNKALEYLNKNKNKLCYQEQL